MTGGFTPGRRQSKTPILSGNVDQKSIETVFSIAICCPTGDKWQSKTLFLSIFDPRSSIVDYIFDCHLPDVGLKESKLDYKFSTCLGIQLISIQHLKCDYPCEMV